MTARTLIVARLTPEAEPAVSDLFANSDATALPHDLGVLRRELYSFHGLYFHHVEFRSDPAAAIAAAAGRDDFRGLSARLEPHVRAYDPATWRSPADATARCFYRWTADGAEEAGAA